MFNEFVNNKESLQFNKELIDVTNGYGDLTQIGISDDEQIFKLVINPKAKKTICFIAGIHGDEKGGPYGVIEYIKSKPHVPKNKKLIIIPLANPYGFKKNKRECADGVDMNRHFMDEELKGNCKIIWDGIKDENISLLHTLHEDPDLKSWYCYYTEHKQIAEDLRELAKKYFPIFSGDERKPLKQDAASDYYGDKIHNGLIPTPHTCRNTIEDKVYLDFAIPYITTETPGMASMKKRAEYNNKAMKLIVSQF
jgi:hypothetical protein